MIKNIFILLKKIKKKSTGFTLMEIIVAIFIFGLTITAVTNFIVQNYKNYQLSLEQSLAIEEARESIKYLVKEARETRASDLGNYPIVEAADNSLAFFSDIDRDVVVEKVRYFRDGNNFKKGVIEPAGQPLQYDPLNEQITLISQNLITTTTPIFFYYNGDYPVDIQNNPLSTPADVTAVKLIRLHLIINVNPLNPPADYILDTFVQLRNLKDNL